MTQRLILMDYVQGLRGSPHGTKGKREMLNISTGCTLGVLGADVFEHDQRGGDIFELLVDFLTDAGPLGAAVGAGALFGRYVVQDRLAGQARRQRLAAVA